MSSVDPHLVVKYAMLVWLLTGLCGFTLYGGYSVIDSIYLMAQIVTTVGYGDPATMMPSTNFGYLFMTFYVLMSVLMLAGFAGAAVDGFLNDQDARIKSAVDRLSRSKSYRNMARRHPGLRKFLRASLMWVVIVAVGIAFFTNWPGEGVATPDGKIQQYTFVQALYMSVITLTTVGFGDETPKTRVGKVFGALWMLFGTVALANMASKFATTFLEEKRFFGLKQLQSSMLQRIQNDAHVRASRENRKEMMDRISKGYGMKDTTIAKAEFMLFMLKELDMVQPYVLDRLEDNFNNLDRDGSGYIDEDDISHSPYKPPEAPA
uniref:Potassium channel domain-containing protein n=1 Tax=Alexandrium monilatum TaxID=311494 RepID=A0A7S4Q208_9DINO